MNIEPKYYDNFLEEHIAQLIDMELREVSWQYDYDSVKNGVNKHWHVFIGHDEGEVEDFGYHISMVWNLQRIKDSNVPWWCLILLLTSILNLIIEDLKLLVRVNLHGF